MTLPASIRTDNSLLVDGSSCAGEFQHAAMGRRRAHRAGPVRPAPWSWLPSRSSILLGRASRADRSIATQPGSGNRDVHKAASRVEERRVRPAGERPLRAAPCPPRCPPRQARHHRRRRREVGGMIDIHSMRASGWKRPMLDGGEVRQARAQHHGRDRGSRERRARRRARPRTSADGREA